MPSWVPIFQLVNDHLIEYPTPSNLTLFCIPLKHLEEGPKHNRINDLGHQKHALAAARACSAQTRGCGCMVF